MNSIKLRRPELDQYLFREKEGLEYSILEKENKLLISRTFLRKNDFITKIKSTDIDSILNFYKSYKSDKYLFPINTLLFDHIPDPSGVVRLYKENKKIIFIKNSNYLSEELRSNAILMKAYETFHQIEEIVCRTKDIHILLVNPIVPTLITNNELPDHTVSLLKNIIDQNLLAKNLEKFTEGILNYISLMYDIKKLYKETINNNILEQ